jgi:hypothetical protein
MGDRRDERRIERSFFCGTTKRGIRAKADERRRAGSRLEPCSGASCAHLHRAEQEPAMPARTEPILTQHARARMQQRGIAPVMLDRLLDYGRERHDHHGAVVVMLDKRARRRLARAGAPGPDLDRLRGVYLVLGHDGAVYTVGHRRRRFRNH